MGAHFGMFKIYGNPWIEHKKCKEMLNSLIFQYLPITIHYNRRTKNPATK